MVFVVVVLCLLVCLFVCFLSLFHKSGGPRLVLHCHKTKVVTKVHIHVSLMFAFHLGET